jgi:Tfp pilus assembly protein PilX
MTKNKQGFALIISLAIMALIVGLILSMSALIRGELKKSSAYPQNELAKQNALLALKLAIADIQKAAGPDQKITSTAAILDSSASTSEIDGVDQPHWTGVWTTGSNVLDSTGSDAQRSLSLGSKTASQSQKSENAAWLVSKPFDDEDKSINPLDSHKDASQIMATSIGPEENDVEVPLASIRNSSSESSGSLAYWVSDEAVKAKVQLEDITFDSNDRLLNQLHHWVPHANAMHKILDLSSTNNDFRDIDNNNIRKIIFPESIKYLSEISNYEDNINKYSTDITTYSRSLITDVKNGGFKRDLTAAFESTDNFQQLLSDYGKGSGKLFRTREDAYPILTIPDQSGKVERPDGLHWHTLFDFYNIYKSTLPVLESAGSKADMSGVGNPKNTLPYSIRPRIICNTFTGDNGVSDIAQHNIMIPQIISYRIDLAISSYLDGGNWKLRLHYYPQLVLYNPYSVRLSMTNFTIGRSMNVWGGVTATVSVNGANVATFDIDGNTSHYWALQTQSGQTDILEPGETRVFGLDADASFASLADAATMRSLVSTASLSPDFSQHVDLPGYAGTADGTATVSISMNNMGGNNPNVSSTGDFPNDIRYPAHGPHRTSTFDNVIGAKTTGSWTDLPISSLTSPRYIKGFLIRKRGLESNTSSNTGNSYDNTSESTPQFMGNSSNAFTTIHSWANKNYESFIVEFGSLYQNGANDIQIQPALNGTSWETSWGDRSVGFDTPGTRIVVADVPVQPMVSLGQFTHMYASFYPNDSSFPSEMKHPSMSLGGSYAHAMIPTDETASLLNANNLIHMDNSFLTNEALFDTYFFSTVPPSSKAFGTTWPDIWTNFNNTNSNDITDTSLPLLNSRIKLRTDKEIASSDLRDIYKAAANLYLDGGFNVNSTSINAWKAFLGGLSGNQIEIYDASQASTVTVGNKSETLIPRFWSATGNSTIDGDWSGLVSLNDTELTELATAIVEQVKTRGPFLSMGDFINRRLGSVGPLTRSGAIQAAIDQTTINSNMSSKGSPISLSDPFTRDKYPLMSDILADSNHFGFKDSDGDNLTSATGMPGYLMQQDIIQNYSAAMTVRSDTFTIRCCGHSNPDQDGKTTKKWLEAVIQRYPEFCDDSQSSDTAIDQLNETNTLMGRKFKIISFRWIADPNIN